MHFEVLRFILIIVIGILTKNLAIFYLRTFIFVFDLLSFDIFDFLFIYVLFPGANFTEKSRNLNLLSNKKHHRKDKSTSTFGMSRICQNNFYLFIPQMMEILKSNNYFKFLTVMSSIDWMPLSSISWTWKLGKLMINLLWISVTQACKSL